jgi:hypothetical protein
MEIKITEGKTLRGNDCLIFNGNKYYYHKRSERYYRTTVPFTILARDIYQYLHPDEVIGDDEFIHHIDHSKTHDWADNPLRMKKGEHSKLHMKGYVHTPEALRKLSLSKMGRKKVNGRYIHVN